MSTFKTALFAGLFGLATVNAHMIMSSPVPYGKSSLTNSPLLADGSDYPCKQRSGVYDLEGAANNIEIGVPQTLSFIGSAVHGGGSCQVSLTTDQAPTKDSTWMVVHSIEGGCPSNVTGNLDANAAGTGAAVFQYTIPEGISPGQYTIAWSWVNKIGNREFYMNCGPATITAAKKKRYAPAQNIRRQSSFPNIFVANLAGVSNGCTTTEGVDITYPDPGASVEQGSIGVKPGPPVGCSGVAAQVSGSSGSPTEPAATSADTGSGTPTTSAGVAAGTSAASVVSVAASSATGGVFATGAASGTAVATSSVLVSPIPEATASSVPVTPNSSNSTTPAGAVTEGAACTDEGEWYCSADGTSFQRCASGMWSAAISMPAGMTCTPGESDNFQENVVQKRGEAHERTHFRRAHRFGRSVGN